MEKEMTQLYTLNHGFIKALWRYTLAFCYIFSVSYSQSIEETADGDSTGDDATGANLIVEVEESPFMLFLRFSTIIFLVTLSAIFSGLTLGLISLDKVALEVTIGAGEKKDATLEEQRNAIAAKRILPIRQSGNLLLTTLVLGNISVNSLLSILMADLTSGLAGFFISTALIVIFGEIIPQALCSRHALAIGSRMAPLVRVLLALFYVFAKPIAFVLDSILGEDMGTIFSKRELEKLLDIHVKRQMLHPAEGHIVRGAMKYKTKQVGSIMKPVDQIYTLPARTRLDSDKIKEIYKHGFSRIPVWDKGINDIIGIVFVKDFVYIDPKEEIPLYDFVQVFGRGIHRVWVDSPLGEVLQVFKKGKLHMALVYDVNNSGPGDPFYELKGMVTLEDIVEEIIQDKIVDETDSLDAKSERAKCVQRVSMDYV